MILVPLIDLKFLTEFAAGGAGTSNRRHWQQERRLIAILTTLFSGKPCVRTAGSGQTQRGRLTAVPLTPPAKRPEVSTARRITR